MGKITEKVLFWIAWIYVMLWTALFAVYGQWQVALLIVSIFVAGVIVNTSRKKVEVIKNENPPS